MVNSVKQSLKMIRLNNSSAFNEILDSMIYGVDYSMKLKNWTSENPKHNEKKNPKKNSTITQKTQHIFTSVFEQYCYA